MRRDDAARHGQIATATAFVAGRPTGSGGRGDPSPATAWTVFGAILAAARRRLGVPDLAGVTVAVQGVGHVGKALVEAGAQVTLTDAVARRAVLVAERHGAQAVAPIDFVRRAVDVPPRWAASSRLARSPICAAR